MKKGKTKIIVVAGPTASGKSDLAIRLARRFDGEIISADSRQVYRGMDIGTGKVKKDKITNEKFLMTNNVRDSSLDIRHSYFSEGVRHWLLDIASPKRQYTAARWRRDAERAIEDIASRGKVPIICGGTGFYIDTAIYGNDLPAVRPNAKLRARLEKKTTEQLFAQLARRDPRRAKDIDPHNRPRLIRALEIVIKTGKPVPASPLIYQSEKYEVLYLAVDISMKKLRGRIEKRLDARLEHGMVAEVRHLHESGVSWKRLENFGLEYRHLARYLQGKYEVRSKNSEAKKPTSSPFALRTSSFQKMREALLHDILRYAKRQMTWWKRNKDIRWISSPAQARTLAREFLFQ